MIVQYGNYKHKVNSTGIAISQDVEENEQGIAIRLNTNINIEGRLQNASRFARSNEFDEIIARMTQAYSIPGQDFGLLHDNGAKAFAFWQNAQTLGGIKAKMVSFPNYKGGEYLTYRSFQIQISFQQPFGNGPRFLRFQETLSFEGGGGRYAVKEVNNGLGIRQRLRTNTICKATQSGTVVGRGAFPVLPLPIWPHALTDDFPKTQKTIRQRGGNLNKRLTLEEMEITYSYEYEWISRLDGIPNYSLGG